MSFRTIRAQCGKKLLVKHLDDLWFCNQFCKLIYKAALWQVQA